MIYTPTDNTVASNTELINNICQPAGIPIVTGEEGICKGCGVATLSISYYDLGYATGEMAVKILRDGKDISTMQIEYATQFICFSRRCILSNSILEKKIWFKACSERRELECWK